MPNSRYNINRSNFTIRKKHQDVKGGKIYERDYMTTTSYGSWESDVFSFSEGNFKMVRRTLPNGYRKHQYGEWIEETDDNQSSKVEGDTGMIPKFSYEVTVPEDIKLKPNYSDISKYSYYGSLSELFRNTVSYILKYFPAEMPIVENILEYFDEEKEESMALGINVKQDIDDVIAELIESGDEEKIAIAERIQNEVDKEQISDTLVQVSNPYLIDIVSKTVNETGTYNPMRYMCESHRRYNVINGDDYVACLCNWEPLFKKRGCKTGELTGIVKINNDFHGNAVDDSSLTDGSQFVIFEYYYNGESILLTSDRYLGFSIRPLKIYIDEFYDNLSEFGNVLINRNTVPKYTATIDSPKETDTGVEITTRSFTWPSVNGYNPDISSVQYSRYISDILDITEFYDEHKTDNLWRKMTHEAIKNMDITFNKNNVDYDSDDFSEGAGKIETILKIYGQFFDGLKRNIDNIKNVNNITYWQDDNLPDYFLTDTLEMSGWEPYNAIDGLENLTINESGCMISTSDANNTFMRNLKLSSGEIFARKGTKVGIEMLLGLFGLRSYDYMKALMGKDLTTNDYEYKIDEYVYVASGGESGQTGEELPVERYNRLKYTYDSDGITTQGLPCMIVEREGMKYIVPWFTSVSELDGHPYYQMYGGWEKIWSKKVTNANLADKTKVLYTDNKRCYPKGEAVMIDGRPDNSQYGDVMLINGERGYNIITWKYTYEGGEWEESEEPLDTVYTCNGYYYRLTRDNLYRYHWELIENANFALYEENLKYINVVRNISELVEINTDRLKGNDIFYVYDISDYSEYYPIDENPNPSHYFYIADKEYSYKYGTAPQNVLDTSIGLGWVNISDSDMREGKNLAIRVLYIESLIDDNMGNAPHVGYSNYDDGDAYLDIYRQIFKGTIESAVFSDDAYSCSTNGIAEDIKNVGFDLIKNRDNVQCWYFTDEEKDGVIYNLTTGESDTNNLVGSEADGMFYESDLEPHNFEGDLPTYKEGAVNSIINTKIMSISFEGKYTANELFKEYFFRSINPYLKQMIPSTTIFDVKFVSDSATYNKPKYALAQGYTQDIDVNALKYMD